MASDLALSREMFEDPSGNLTLEQVEQAPFQPMGITISEGLSESAFWVRLRIRPSATGDFAVLLLDRTFLDEVRLYAPDPAHPGHWNSRATGDRYPYEQRDLPTIPLEFAVKPSAPDNTYYLRIKSTSSIFTNIEALDPLRADRKNNRAFVIQSFYFIVLLFLLFWSCRDYAENRQTVGALLILYLTSFIFNNIALFGYIAVFAPAGFPQLADGVTNVAVCSLVFTSLLFHQALFKLFSPPPVLMQGFKLLLLLFPLELAAMMLGYTHLALQTNVAATFLAGPYFLVLALFARQQVAPGLKVLRLVYSANAIFLLFLTGTALNLITPFHVDTVELFTLVASVHIGYGLMSSSMMFMIIHLRARQLNREMRQAVLAKNQIEQRFRLFMDNSPTIAWIKDTAGQFQYINRTFEQRFGLAAQDLQG